MCLMELPIPTSLIDQSLCPSRPSPLRGPAPPLHKKREGRQWASLLRLPKTGGEEAVLGGEEASLLPSRKREGRRASVFACACCAGTYSMGQPRRVSTQSARRQMLNVCPKLNRTGRVYDVISHPEVCLDPYQIL